ncbi:NAD(P)H-hydrate epimerase [Sulfitobacter sp. S190]|uniref:NAD(P)H-hydrate epimerase n=1 Tax=Sulfitobacter sp. S190 TaxID=2867022 RepID=UPI0021A351C2|nr:NAD(P)H-hydrate epimerase [Sulfitobacter sp. S190]UWR21300.1 NAD(P)H-hydrate epimerase [Sulfitobacter sp. S190]
MTEILTAADMRALEQRAIASGRVTGAELMERAGQGVVDAIKARWPDLPPEARRAVVLCGPGNNGGDGFVIARLLDAAGWSVEVQFFGDAARLPPDAALNYARWARDHPVWTLCPRSVRRVPNLGEVAVFVDALFGIGLSRPVQGALAEIVGYLAGSGGDAGYFQPRLVAVDVPSGLDADSGRVLGCPDPRPFRSLAPYAALTVTFDSPKPGHFLADGPDLCGALVVCDIGLGEMRAVSQARVLRPVRLRLVPGLPEVADLRDAVECGPERLAKRAGHKFDHGSALVLSGGVGRGGAARLAARAALRVGAGVVTVGCPPSALMEHAARLDAILLARLADGAALEAVLAQDTRINALAVGPALGTDARAADMVRAALASQRACVLDADALTLIARDDGLRGLLHPKCVLTPHGGEFARVFPEIAARLAGPEAPKAVPEWDGRAGDRFAETRAYHAALAAQSGPLYSKIDAVRDAAAQVGCTVLLKGPDTVVAGPEGITNLCHARYDRAVPWLATAGAGDTLAGIITGLMARQFAPRNAATLGAWLHQECALSFGPGLIAEDLAGEIPKVLRAQGL